VLALHLHSALSGCKKLPNDGIYRIARDLDGMFEDASLDLRKASATGDDFVVTPQGPWYGERQEGGMWTFASHGVLAKSSSERDRWQRGVLCAGLGFDGRQQGSLGRIITNNENKTMAQPSRIWCGQ
jgi:hypothetical protein